MMRACFRHGRVAELAASSLLAFVLAFLALVGSTAAAWQFAPHLRDRVKNITLADRPPDDAHYLAHDRGGHVDHHVLYFGIDAESRDNLRRAEVLFLGNSRLMFALQSRVLQPFFSARGLSYFALGFGFNEGDAFPSAVIERFDLRPRVIVVNVDGFFGEGLSEWAQEVVRDTPFIARKLRWEAEASHEARRVIHQAVPNWLNLFGRPGFNEGREFIAYRSRVDGTWAISPWPEAATRLEVPPLDAPAPGRTEIAAARQFAEAMTARGARVLLTSVPAPTRRGAGPAHFAALLHAPLITPAVAGLTTHDGSHLTPTSALAWARAFVSDLDPHLPGDRR